MAIHNLTLHAFEVRNLTPLDWGAILLAVSIVGGFLPGLVSFLANLATIRGHLLRRPPTKFPSQIESSPDIDREFKILAIEFARMRSSKTKNDRWRAAFARVLDKYGILKLEEFADRGNIDAQVIIGLAYITSLSLEEDHSKSIYFLRKAAENNEADALVYLAYSITDGISVSKSDMDEGRRLIEKAASSRHPVALMAFSRLLREGEWGTAKDASKAKAVFNEAFEKGYIPAKYLLGEELMRSRENEENKSRGEKLIRETYREGYLQAKLKLAHWTREGTHGEYQDGEKAKRLYSEIVADPDSDMYTAHQAQGWLNHYPKYFFGDD